MFSIAAVRADADGLWSAKILLAVGNSKQLGVRTLLRLRRNLVRELLQRAMFHSFYRGPKNHPVISEKEFLLVDIYLEVSDQLYTNYN